MLFKEEKNERVVEWNTLGADCSHFRDSIIINGDCFSFLHSRGKDKWTKMVVDPRYPIY